MTITRRGTTETRIEITIDTSKRRDWPSRRASQYSLARRTAHAATGTTPMRHSDRGGGVGLTRGGGGGVWRRNGFRGGAVGEVARRRGDAR